MAVKEIPINMRTYYSSMVAAYTQLKTDAVSAKEDLVTATKELWQDIYDKRDVYLNEFKVNISEYDEFVNNKYETGVFARLAKGMFLNRKNNYVIVADLFDLLTLSKRQKQIHDLEKDIEFYNKLLSLNFKQYTEILKIFYSEVQRRMILNGEGYVFEDNIGWTCINRCHIVNRRPMLDFDKTKKKRAELIAQGKRIYNREEAEFCRVNGLQYDGVDPRVYKNEEYCYEIPLLGCKLTNGTKFKFEPTDYRGREIRGKHNDELIQICHNDIHEICNLPLGVRAKLTLCNTVDKMLYLNFIRNEAQKPSNATTIGGKNR